MDFTFVLFKIFQRIKSIIGNLNFIKNQQVRFRFYWVTIINGKVL